MTSQTITSAPRVDYSRLYGVTHTPDGVPVVRVPKLIKVSIGAPKGKAIVVYTQRTDDAKPAWVISVGAGQNAKSHRFPTRQEAERAYPDLLKSAPDAVYPRKLGFFAFTRPTADGTYEPAWDAIEQHGPMPTEIDVLFFHDEPFETSFAMWGATELRCKGNGLQAERLVRFILNEDKTATDAERFVAKQQQDGRVAIDGCWSQGCRFSRPTTVNGKEQPSPCKPSGDLKFQLASSIVIGGTAFFHTTGFRSITQIFSSLAAFKQLTGGRLAGIPMRFVIRPYMTKHNGQAAKQYGVSLEFRAETMEALKRKLIEQASAFREFLPAAPLQLTGGASGFDGPQAAAFNEEDVEDLTGLTEENEAAMINAEFTDGGEASVDASGGAAAATAAKTAALRERMAAPVAASAAAAPTAAPMPSTATGAFF